MSNKIWQKSNLCVGESVRVPSSLFIEGDKSKERLISATYIGETDAGIMIECTFKPSIITTPTSSQSYKMLINWASIWCGDVKIYNIDGKMIRAKRIKGHPISKQQINNN